MDELGILDMDELEIQHTQLEFQQEQGKEEHKKNGHSHKGANDIKEDATEKKRKRIKNQGKETTKQLDKGAAVYNIDLMDSFQTIKNVDRSNGKYRKQELYF